MAEVLLIDDERTITELFKFMFSEAGHSVAVAANGQEALERIQESIPDFMVVDVAMPVMSGREFIAELSEMAKTDPRYAGIPFVVMTGENFMETGLNKDFASTPGFVCFFSKMIPPEIVIQKMNEFLGLM